MWISDQMKTLPFLYSKNLYWDIQCAKDNLIPFLFDCFASLSLKKKHLPVAKVHFPLNHAWIKFTAETIYSMKKKKIVIVLLIEQIFLYLSEFVLCLK